MLTRKSKIADIQANSTSYERAKHDRKRAKKRLSPDVMKMYSIEIPAKRIIYYQETLKKCKIKFSELTKLYPDYEIFIKNPISNN